MRHSIIKGVALATLAMSMVACDENSWNNKYLDGFEEDPAPTQVQNVSYTLTTQDYATISGLSANVQQAGEANAAALAALKKTCAFTSVITPQDYIPAFLVNSQFKYFTLSDGSTIKVSYDYAESLPEVVDQLGSANFVTISKADYQAAWGSDEDFIQAFTPAVKPSSKIPAILKESLGEGEANDYVVVSYKYAEQEPIFQTPDDPETPDTPSGKDNQFFIIADGHAAAALAEDKKYGYLPAVEVSLDDLSTLSEENLFTFTPVDDGFYIQDCYGRYIYQTGTYNSFNVSEEVVDGCVWELANNADGSVSMVNTLTEKTIQYDPKYNSYGSYEEITGIIPGMYQTSAPGASGYAGDYVIITAGKAATTVDEAKSYGYLPVIDADASDLSDIADNAVFTITAADGGYYIQDCYGRYLYQTGTYNSFNFSAEVKDGAVWSITAQADGTVAIVNTVVAKTVQYDENYSSYGSYPEITHELPQLKALKGAAKIVPCKAPVMDVYSTVVYAMYESNGSGWSEDASVAVLQHADYAAMGSAGDYIPVADAKKFLPIYLKNAFPYAAKNAVKNVVYFSDNKNSVAASQYIYNGSEWVNNNGIVSKTTKFTKVKGVWEVAPGLAVFTHTKAKELVSGEKYLIVTDGQAATALSTSKTYGYLNPTTVEYDEENLYLEDPSECEFTLTLEDNGWTIVDNYGRYYYQTGTYNSFNVASEVSSSSADGFYWDIEISEEDGTATIKNNVVFKVIQYDENYKSYGSYATITHTLPTIYRAVGQ